MKTPTRRLPKKAVVALSVLWLLALGAGHFALGQYKSAPGEGALAPEAWPKAARVSPAQGLPTLVMLAHPLCPCTRASVNELAKLMTRLEGRLVTRILVTRPQDASEEWLTGAAWDASRIPGVTVHRDDNGEDAARFGAKTSGQVVLYSAAGRLLFRGGITASRGHEGTNSGVRAIEALVRGQAALAESRVYGCSLQGEEE